MTQRAKVDINLYQGDSRSYKFTFFTDAAQTIPWNFSAATAVSLAAKNSLDQTNPIFSVSAFNNQNGNDWANGIAVFKISSANSILLSKNGKYDVQVTLAGDKITPVYGDVLCQKQVQN